MDPVLGKFVSEDRSRDGYNWYAYCEDNPITNIDPSGLTSLGDIEEAGAINAELESGSGGSAGINALNYAKSKIYNAWQDWSDNLLRSLLGDDNVVLCQGRNCRYWRILGNDEYIIRLDPSHGNLHWNTFLKAGEDCHLINTIEYEKFIDFVIGLLL